MITSTDIRKAVNEHVAFHGEGLSIVYMDQSRPRYDQGNEILELTVMGPYFETEVRQRSATLLISIRGYVIAQDNLYHITTLSDKIVSILERPFTIGDQCIKAGDIRVRPIGQVEHPVKAVGVQVTTDLRIEET